MFLSGTLLCQMPHYLHTVKYTAACNHFQTSVFYMCCVCMFVLRDGYQCSSQWRPPWILPGTCHRHAISIPRYTQSTTLSTFSETLLLHMHSFMYVESYHSIPKTRQLHVVSEHGWHHQSGWLGFNMPSFRPSSVRLIFFQCDLVGFVCFAMQTAWPRLCWDLTTMCLNISYESMWCSQSLQDTSMLHTQILDNVEHGGGVPEQADTGVLNH